MYIPIVSAAGYFQIRILAQYGEFARGMNVLLSEYPSGDFFTPTEDGQWWEGGTCFTAVIEQLMTFFAPHLVYKGQGSPCSRSLFDSDDGWGDAYIQWTGSQHDTWEAGELKKPFAFFPSSASDCLGGDYSIPDTPARLGDGFEDPCSDMCYNLLSALLIAPDPKPGISVNLVAQSASWDFTGQDCDLPSHFPSPLASEIRAKMWHGYRDLFDSHLSDIHFGVCVSYPSSDAFYAELVRLMHMRFGGGGY